MREIFTFFEVILFFYFAYVILYSLLFSLAGLFYRIPVFSSANPILLNRIAVLIPCYKEDNVIVNVAKQALIQTYQKENYDVIVIADSLSDATLTELSSLNITIHKVQFDKSTKVKSLQSFLNSTNEYEIAVILDADNVMDHEFLTKINQYYNNGWNAIQGQRTAKNKNTSFAILDGLSEAIANHINRQGAIALGLSSPIIGSGMAFRFSLFKNILNTIDSVGGFDKELQI